MNQIGIDLGTTNTVACHDSEILGIGDGGVGCLPSVVAFLPNGTVATGQGARRRRAIDGHNTIFSSKRIIGRRFDETQTREFRDRYPFELVDGGHDGPLFETRAGRFSPTQIASILLDRIAEPVADEIRSLRIVIAVPTSFGAAQCEATLEAARSAGFLNMRLVDEAEATAHAYQLTSNTRGLTVVYDLGGGTFEVSVLECTDDSVRVLSRASEPFLGGDDIDQKIAEWVTNEMLKQHNWDLGNYDEVAIRLLAECERAKIRLASAEETRLDLSQVDPECPIASEGLVLRRSVMDSLCMDLVQRTFVSCDAAIADAGVKPGDLSSVLLAGGATHLSVVQAGVEAYFGRPGLVEFEPTSVVAQGASLAPE